jgi:hypothetical protein
VVRVFISHASADRDLAEQVLGWVLADGHEAFLDHDLHAGLAVGEQWQERLYERLRWADAVVPIVTEACLASTWCAAEVGIASAQGSRLLPLRVAPGLVHPLLSDVVQYADLTDRPTARERLHEALARMDAVAGRGWGTDRCPYPGLRAFDADLHRVFFGRDREVRELAGLLREPGRHVDAALLVVLGPSGCGKSSLVRAGLLPVMAREPDWWSLAPILPGADPVGALARELADSARRLGLDWTVDHVGRRLRHEDGLAAVAGELLLATPCGRNRRRLLLVVDQLEELLTLAGAEQRRRLTLLLRPALAGPVHAVATVRPEFLAQLLESRELAGLQMHPYAMRPLHRQAIPTVIEEPARLAGIGIDEDLVRRLAADTGTGDALPLLAFTLEQLAVGVRHGGRLSLEHYEQLGGVRGALIRQAEAALTEAQGCSGRSREDVMTGLLRLVTVDEQGRPAQRRVPRDELPQPLREELDAFVARRLLSTDTEAGTVFLAVAHEAFFSAWPPLATAIARAAVALRARRLVEEAAHSWDSADRPSSRLWQRGQLAAAVNDVGAHVVTVRRGSSIAPAPWLGSLRGRRRGAPVLLTDKIDLSAQAEAFLRASLRSDVRRRARAGAVLSGLLAMAVAAAAIAAVQAHDARSLQRAADEQRLLATARGLMAQADTLSGRDPRTAMRLRLAALSLHEEAQNRASIVESVVNSHYAGSLVGHSRSVYALSFSADGRLLASGGGDDAVLLWDLSRGGLPRPAGKLPGHSARVVTIAFDGDGRTVATGADDGTVLLWSVRNPARPERLSRMELHQDVSQAALSADGRTLATVGSDGAIRVLDVTDPGGSMLWDIADLQDRRRHAVERACQLLDGRWGKEQWDQYLPGVQYRNTCPGR